jgi:DNA polymerase III subunit delta
VFHLCKFMIIFLCGEDTYSSGQKLNEIKAKFKEKTDPSGINIITFEGDSPRGEAGKFDLEKFSSAASQSGFLVNKRLIIVKNLLASKLPRDTAESLKELMGNLKDSPNIFVFWEQGKPDARTALYKQLTQDKKFVQEFALLSDDQLTRWVKNYIQKQNGQIEPMALNLLILGSDNNLWQLTNDLDKLLAYSQNKITAEAVKQLVQPKIDENIFGLIDAIASDNKSLALKMLNEQLNLGLNHIYIVSMIIRQFRIIVKLRSLLDQSLNLNEITKRAGLHPFVIKKSLPLAKKFTLVKLQKIYDQLLTLEKRFKSTSLSPQALLELFIMQI